MNVVREMMVSFTHLHMYPMPSKEIIRHQKFGIKINLVTLHFGGFVLNWLDYWRATYELGYMERNGRYYDAYRMDQVHKMAKKGES